MKLICIAPHLSVLSLPLMESRLSAGFPFPVADGIEKTLDLNAHLITRPAASFFVRICGDSMTGAGIFDGDIAIVDRSLTPKAGDIVVAVLDGELTIKRLTYRSGHVVLKAENPDYPDISIPEEQDLVIWGVVTSTIHEFHSR